MMRQGFTLIELLVVVLIMGILASVAMPQYFKSVEKARSAEAIAVLSALASARDRLILKYGSFSCDMLVNELDISIKDLTYFNQPTATCGTSSINISIKRNTPAGGGLGEYTIRLSKNGSTSPYKWACNPTSAGCKSFLPK